jgi:thiamine-phosphate pyrophosphorylase
MNSLLLNFIRGLYAVTPDTGDSAALITMTRSALAGGVRLVQYRNKSAGAELRLAQASALLKLCRDHGAILIVNDHVDLAAEIGAHGAHIGGEDGTLAAARDILGPEKLIGISCYKNLASAEAAAAGGADYIAFGSFFASSVKPSAVRAPLSLLAAARPLGLPIVAIGGITPDNAGSLIDAGADAVAVISALFAAPDVEAAARRFTKLFDTAKP